MKDFLNKLIGSLNNKSEGFSAKKLTAFIVVGCIVAAHIKWIALGDFSQLVSVLMTDFSFVSVLFGINVVDKRQNPAE